MPETCRQAQAALWWLRVEAEQHHRCNEEPEADQLFICTCASVAGSFGSRMVQLSIRYERRERVNNDRGSGPGRDITAVSVYHSVGGMETFESYFPGTSASAPSAWRSFRADRLAQRVPLRHRLRRAQRQIPVASASSAWRASCCTVTIDTSWVSADYSAFLRWEASRPRSSART
jgi:hypothetical protein